MVFMTPFVGRSCALIEYGWQWRAPSATLRHMCRHRMLAAILAMVLAAIVALIG
jgi:hypothetical protein